jgi:hypothetical protein
VGQFSQTVYPQGMARKALVRETALFVLALVAASGCSGSRKDVALTKTTPAFDPSTVPVPPADGPRLLAVVPAVSIQEAPKLDARPIGILRGGASVARAKEAISKEGCPGGWYPVRPRGFVCVGQVATLDMNHPALGTFRTQPKLDAPLPYTYARTAAPTSLYEWDRSRGAAVKEAGKLRKGSGIAMVGSWDAATPDGKNTHLGMTAEGKFVASDAVKEAEVPNFKGVELGEQARLPLAFVVKLGVRTWKVDKQKADKKGNVEPLTSVKLTGKFRTIGDEKFWATEEGRYVRHKDVTVVPPRSVFPDFATSPDQKWIDISVVTGTLVAYLGRKPVFATLVSPGRDRMGDPKTAAVTQMGVFPITGKHISASKPGAKPWSEDFDLQDVPWVLDLASGQSLHGSWWHSRFGIEYGPGNVQMAPADAAWLFRWAGPELPEGWHEVTLPLEADKKTMVVIRK